MSRGRFRSTWTWVAVIVLAGGVITASLLLLSRAGTDGPRLTRGEAASAALKAIFVSKDYPEPPPHYFPSGSCDPVRFEEGAGRWLLKCTINMPTEKVHSNWYVDDKSGEATRVPD